MITAFMKLPRLVLILIVSNDVRNDSLPVPYLPVLILFSLGEMDSVLLWGEPKSRNFSIPFWSIPASSSIAIEPLLRTVTRTFVASSSKAFSTSSLMISVGDTQVLVANSLKNDGWTFIWAGIFSRAVTFTPLFNTCQGTLIVISIYSNISKLHT